MQIVSLLRIQNLLRKSNNEYNVNTFLNKFRVKITETNVLHFYVKF